MSQLFSDILLSSKTRSQLESFVAKPSNALLITGKQGSGKKRLAKFLSATLIGVEPDKLAESPQFFRVSKPEDKAEIPIESVREVAKKMSLRVATDSDSLINRAVLFEDAQELSHEAQNALLKLLEEPPKQSLIILTSTADDSLLPTVVSRTQTISVVPPSLAQAIEFYKDQPETKVTSAYRLSKGTSELLDSLLSSQDEHDLKIGVGQAKIFIKSNTYERLIQLQTISKDKNGLVVFLEALSRVLAALHEDSILSDKTQLSARVLGYREAVETAINQLNLNSNVRLVSLGLALNFSI